MFVGGSVGACAVGNMVTWNVCRYTSPLLEELEGKGPVDSCSKKLCVYRFEILPELLSNSRSLWDQSRLTHICILFIFIVNVYMHKFRCECMSWKVSATNNLLLL